MMEYLENNVFEHQAEIAAMHERFDRLEEDNRCLRLELFQLRTENKQLVRMKEELDDVYSELDVLKRHLKLIPPLPNPYRRAADPRGAPFATWRRDRTRAKFRPPPIRTDTAQASLPLEIQLEENRRHKSRARDYEQQSLEIYPSKAVPVLNMLSEQATKEKQPPVEQRLKRGREDTKLSPISPRPPIKRRRSQSGDRLDTSTPDENRNTNPTYFYIDLGATNESSHNPVLQSLVLVPSHALACP